MKPFSTAREAALAVLSSGAHVSRKGGSFLGQTVVDPTPLSASQRDWLIALLKKAGLPPLDQGAS